MGGIDRIKNQILQDAENERQKIIDDANKKAKELKDEAKKESEKIIADILKKATVTTEEKKRRAISMEHLEQRKSLLKAKQDLIDEVFNIAEKRLEKMPPEKYRNLIYNMMLKSVEMGNEEIIISEKDKEVINQALIDKVNESLNNQGKSGNLKLSTTYRDMIGGFILKTQDVEINSTFDSIIKQEREELETKIAKILFEE